MAEMLRSLLMAGTVVRVVMVEPMVWPAGTAVTVGTPVILAL
jgi:hypothetical protein